jgi:hypothetical protein
MRNEKTAAITLKVETVGSGNLSGWKEFPAARNYRLRLRQADTPDMDFPGLQEARLRFSRPR